MKVGFIKDEKCINIAEFDSAMTVQEFKVTLTQEGIVDTIVYLPDGFGIGDSYKDGVWSKQDTPIIAQDPSTEDRLAALEAAMSFMLGM